MDNCSALTCVLTTVLSMHSMDALIVVDGYVPTDPKAHISNLRDAVWAYALDQRAFGPRKLLVFFADACGSLLGFAVTARTEPIDDAFLACLFHLGEGAEAAVAYLDEPVHDGPAAPEHWERFDRLRDLAASRGITLVDWISCDDDRFRASRMADPLNPGADWWHVDARGS